MRNVYKDIFEENQERIQMVTKENEGNETNIPYDPTHSYYLEKLKYFCIDVFEKNKKLLRKRKIVRNLKFFASYGIPLISMILTSKFILKIPRKEETIPTYVLESMVVSDGNIWVSAEDDNTYVVGDGEYLSND